MREFELSDVAETSAIEREVAILMSDMVGYSRLTAHMRPNEIRDFVVDYHNKLRGIVVAGQNAHVHVEPLAGDGALIIFESRAGEKRANLAARAVSAATRLAAAVASEVLPPTRIGLHFGEIIETELNGRPVQFGASFSVAARLEELCDYFGTPLLMDQEIASHCHDQEFEVVSVGKITLQSFARPMQVFTVYKPGLQNIPADVDRNLLAGFIALRRNAMNYFCGDESNGLLPDFPAALELLVAARKLFMEMTGCPDRSIERIIEYIRETPRPDSEFFHSGMRLSKKGRESLGAKLFHLSEELLKAINHEFYHALVVDTGWEKYFKLEWHKKGENVITINDIPDGVYFIDSGQVVTLNEHGEEMATLSAGTIFGEMAYFSKRKRRTATVRAKTDVVLRKVSSEDFEKLPVIAKIFERIAEARR